MAKLVHITTVPISFNFLRGQIPFMIDCGYDVAGISSSGKLPAGLGIDEGFTFYPIEMPRAITPVQDLVALRSLYILLRRLRPQIVHGHTPKGGLLAMLAATMAAVPVKIYQLHGLPMTTATGGKRFLLEMAERISCGLADQVVAVGNTMRDTVVDQGICRPEKVSVLATGSSNGVDAKERFNPARFDDGQREALRQELGIPKDAPVVGFVGRLVKDKGVIELVDAWTQLRSRHPTARLLMVGPFEEKDAVPAATKHTLQNDPRIILTGFREDTHRLYSLMDFLVLPTYREGFPNTPLEAAAMELPVIASDIGPCREAVADEKSGLIVALGSVCALVDAMERYLTDEQLRREHGAFGRARALKDFEPERIWKELENIYSRLLQEHGSIVAGRSSGIA